MATHAVTRLLKGIMEAEKKQSPGIWLQGFGENLKPYPAWRYHSNNLFEPVIVQNTEEDEKAALEGWKSLDVPITGMQHLSNWRHDLEDMTAKQLVLFAKEEFGVDLPVEAGDIKLVKAMWSLTHLAPQHSGRITLLAQSIEMDYDATLDEIRALAENLGENETREVTI